MSNSNEDGGEHISLDAGEFFDQVPRIDPSVQRTFDELNILISELLQHIATFENNLGNSSTYRVADDLASETNDWTRCMQLQQVLDQVVTIADQQQANMEMLREMYQSAGVPMAQNEENVIDSRMALMRTQINIMQRMMSEIRRVDVSVSFATAGAERFASTEECDYGAKYRLVIDRRADLRRTEQCIDLYTQELLPLLVSRLRTNGQSSSDIRNRITFHVSRIGSLQHERNFLEFLVEISEDALDQGHNVPEDSRTEKLVDRVYAELRFFEPVVTALNIEEVD